MKTPYSEGWDAGFRGIASACNPYVRGWMRYGDGPPESAKHACEWLNGWNDGYEAGDHERAAEDDSRKRDARFE